MTKWARRLLTCRQCGYEWVSRAINPKKCPRCQSWHWKGGK